MLPDDLTIKDILPHREPMLLIGQVLAVDADRAVTRSTVSDRWPLSDGQGVHALVLIELAAQTAGVNNGLQMRLSKGSGSNHKGWIVGIKSARFEVSGIALGTEITVTARNQFAYEGFREIQAEAEIGGRIIAEITMQLMQADEAAAG